MQFTTLAVSALSIVGALAQSKSASKSSSSAATKATGTSSSITVHVVKVGSANGTLAYSPNNLKAAVGDMVQFQFAPANHTVTQSTFDEPCMPIAMNSNVTGIYSGFMPVAATSTTTPTYTIMVNSTTPMWLYCSQAKHCQSGMTMVINENTAANASRSLANFQTLAKAATVNLPGGAVADGTKGSTSSNSTSSTGATGSTGSTGSTNSGASSTTSGSTSTSTGAAGALRATEASTLGALFIAAMAFLL